MMNCREASELVSRGLDTKLPLHQQLSLRLHLKLCEHCTRYRSQLVQLREVLRRGAEEMSELAALQSFTLRGEERARLTRAVVAETGA